MTTTKRRMQDWWGRPALVLALGLLLSPLAGSAPGAASSDTVWLRVEVHDRDADRQKVKINLPISLIEVVVDSIDKREFMAEIESAHPSLDIARLWREIRRMPAEDFVTAETEKEHVRVWKDRTFFRINVHEGDLSEPKIELKIPLDLMDYLFESRGRTFDFQEIVERLRSHLPLTLVEVREEHESVRIWLEEQ